MVNSSWNAETFEKKFEQRTIAVATEKGLAQQERTRKILDRHTEFLGPKLVATLVQRDYESVFQDTVEKRESGRLNDDHSIAPGVRAIVNNLAPAIKIGEPLIEEICEEGGSVYADALKPAEGTEDCYEFYLPRGRYRVWEDRTCQLFGEVAEERGLKHRFPITLGHHRVVRLEGDSGELWQNPFLTPEGSPLAQAV